MKRKRRCCCCRPGQTMTIAESPTTSGTWNLTPYQTMTFPKYKGKYWDVSQNTNIRARGRIGNDGKLMDLPNSVALLSGQGNAVLRVRCSPICGDPNYYGEVIATNAGIVGPWNLSPYREARYMSLSNGRWAIRSINIVSNTLWTDKFDPADFAFPPSSSRTGIFRTGTISADGELINLPAEYEFVSGKPYYAELVVDCTDSVWVPVWESVSNIESPSGDTPMLIYYGKVEGLETFVGAAGIGPPGFRWRAVFGSDNQPGVTVCYDAPSYKKLNIGWIDSIGRLNGFSVPDYDVPTDRRKCPIALYVGRLCGVTAMNNTHLCDNVYGVGSSAVLFRQQIPVY